MKFLSLEEVKQIPKGTWVWIIKNPRIDSELEEGYYMRVDAPFMDFFDQLIPAEDFYFAGVDGTFCLPVTKEAYGRQWVASWIQKDADECNLSVTDIYLNVHRQMEEQEARGGELFTEEEKALYFGSKKNG